MAGSGSATNFSMNNPNPTPIDAMANDLITMPNDELLELYQQISSRVGMYNTEDLILRMFAIRNELSRRYSDLIEEVEVLRNWGNKDCTAMADAELEGRRASRRI